MYGNDGITKDEVATIVNTFPNQGDQPYMKVILIHSHMEHIQFFDIFLLAHTSGNKD